jgi:hypothetical protein
MIMGPPNALAWAVLERPNEIVPMNDIREHVTGMRCWCNPEVDETMMTIHNALDGRDEFMEGRRRPS